jgi:hypothetical protein
MIIALTIWAVAFQKCVVAASIALYGALGGYIALSHRGPAEILGSLVGTGLALFVQAYLNNKMANKVAPYDLGIAITYDEKLGLTLVCPPTGSQSRLWFSYAACGAEGIVRCNETLYLLTGK